MKRIPNPHGAPVGGNHAVLQPHDLAALQGIAGFGHQTLAVVGVHVPGPKGGLPVVSGRVAQQLGRAHAHGGYGQGLGIGLPDNFVEAGHDVSKVFLCFPERLADFVAFFGTARDLGLQIAGQ